MNGMECLPDQFPESSSGGFLAVNFRWNQERQNGESQVQQREAAILPAAVAELGHSVTTKGKKK